MLGPFKIITKKKNKYKTKIITKKINQCTKLQLVNWPTTLQYIYLGLKLLEYYIKKKTVFILKKPNQKRVIYDITVKVKLQGCKNV